jgi:hypothetical protein
MCANITHLSLFKCFISHLPTSNIGSNRKRTRFHIFIFPFFYFISLFSYQGTGQCCEFFIIC